MSSMATKPLAVYPGSFDPPTLGHVDLIHRASEIFDVIVLIADNSKKSSFFTPAERKKLLEDCLKKLKNVKVDIFSGLTVDYLRKKKSRVILRGLRAISDFDLEVQMATMNRKLFPEVETFVMMSDERYLFVASSLVKEVASHGGDVSALVPTNVARALENRRK